MAASCLAQVGAHFTVLARAREDGDSGPQQREQAVRKASERPFSLHSFDVGGRQAQALNPLSKFQSSWGPHKPNTRSNECPSHPWYARSIGEPRACNN